MMKFATTSLVVSTATLGLMLGAAQSAKASSLPYRVPNVTASVTGTTTNTNGGYNIADMLNGKGLPSNLPSLTGNHALTAAGNSWRSVLNPSISESSPIKITFDFGIGRNLTGLSFWNATGISSAGFGVKNVTFEYSTDGTNFSALTPIAFNGGAWTGAFTQGGAAPQLVDFKQVYARQVRFNITSNYSGNRLAINEVQFQAIPEPSASLALLTLGLGGMVVGLRKRV